MAKYLQDFTEVWHIHDFRIKHSFSWIGTSPGNSQLVKKLDVWYGNMWVSSKLKNKSFAVFT